MIQVNQDPQKWKRQCAIIFRDFDKDKSGFIDISELQQGLLSFGVALKPDEVQALRIDLDRNADGVISLEELQAAFDKKMLSMRTEKHASPIEEVWNEILRVALHDPSDWDIRTKQLFATLDMDGTGSVALSELSSGLRSLGLDFTSDQIELLHDSLDENFDGDVSLAEFQRAVSLHDPRNVAKVKAWRAVTEKISDDPKAWDKSVEDLFKSALRGNKGEASVQDLGFMFESLGVQLTQEQVLEFLGEIDGDHNGKFSLNEFKDAVEKIKPRRGAFSSAYTVDNAWRKLYWEIEDKPTDWNRSSRLLFNTFDINRSGEIDVVELTSGLLSLGISLEPYEVSALQTDLDSNHDGRITLAEFEEALERVTIKFQELARTSRLRKKAWETVLESVQRHEKDWATSVKTLFKRLDRDDSSRLSTKDVVDVLHSLGVTLRPPEREALRSDLEEKFGGSVSCSEFLDFVDSKYQEHDEVDIVQDLSGNTKMEEAQQALVAAVHGNPKHGWRSEAEALFKSWDRDEDGKLNASELADGFESIGISLEAEQVRFLKTRVKRHE